MGYALVIAELGHALSPGSLNADVASRSDRPSHPPAVTWIAVLLMVTPLYGLMTDWTPVRLVLFSQAATVVLIPVLSLALLRLTRNRDVMGARASGTLRTGVMLAMTAVSLWILWQNVAVWTAPIVHTVASWRVP